MTCPRVHCVLLTAVLTTSLSRHLTDGLCEDGWMTYKTDCILICVEPLSYMEAFRKCMSMRSSLASVHNPEENQFVHNISARLQQQVWLGLEATSSDSWSPVDGTSLQWTNWNKSVTSTESSGAVAAMLPSDGTWIALQYDTRHNKPFVCKKKSLGSSVTDAILTTVAVYVSLPMSLIAIILVIVLSVMVHKMSRPVDKHELSPVTSSTSPVSPATSGGPADTEDHEHNQYAIIEDSGMGDQRVRANAQPMALPPEAFNRSSGLHYSRPSFDDGVRSLDTPVELPVTPNMDRKFSTPTGVDQVTANVTYSYVSQEKLNCNGSDKVPIIPRISIKAPDGYIDKTFTRCSSDRQLSRIESTTSDEAHLIPQIGSGVSSVNDLLSSDSVPNTYHLDCVIPVDPEQSSLRGKLPGYLEICSP